MHFWRDEEKREDVVGFLGGGQGICAGYQTVKNKVQPTISKPVISAQKNDSTYKPDGT